MDLHVGQEFDTIWERGCVVVTLPDKDGNFDAKDSDGIICSYHLSMVCCVGE